ncbi:MAG: hypothetical protein RIT45_4259, partial [Pseudomonadota bacterium]
MHRYDRSRLQAARRDARAGLLAAGLLAAALALPGCATQADTGANKERIAALEKRIEALEAQLAAPKLERVTIVDKEGKERAMLGLR